MAKALEAYTRNPAYAAGKEGILGTFEPGKYADFVVPDEDPTLVPPGEILQIRVEAVAVGGRFVVGAEGFALE